MQFKTLALASLAAVAVSAQGSPSLSGLLSSTSDLSTLNGLLGQLPRVAAALANATDITILAPSNEAFATLFGGSDIKINASTSAAVEAVLAYHVLQGAIPSSDITTTPAFIPTLLTAPFANVTGGQVVEAIKNGSDVLFVSGLKSVSKVVKPVSDGRTKSLIRPTTAG